MANFHKNKHQERLLKRGTTAKPREKHKWLKEIKLQNLEQGNKDLVTVSSEPITSP